MTFFFSFSSFKKTLIKKEKILLLCRLKLANVIPQSAVWEFYIFLLPSLFSLLSLLFYWALLLFIYISSDRFSHKSLPIYPLGFILKVAHS